MSKQIQIRIAPDGALKAEAEGFSGNACELAVRKLVAGLGESKGEHTMDYYGEQPVEEQQNIGQ